jgi:8-oxo-dGTP diphosphatase
MKINYCLECALPLTKQDDTLYICLHGHEFWNNPHAGAIVVFLKDGLVLCTKRGIKPREGLYGLPGGFLKYGENAYDAAVREMREETGVIVSDLTLFDVHAADYDENDTTAAVIYLARSWEGEFTAGDDAAELAWKPIDFLDSDQIAWPYPGLAAKLKSIV